MARTEAKTASKYPDLGEEISYCLDRNDGCSSPNHANLDDWIDVLCVKYQASSVSVRALFEAIRLIIIQYDELIDTVD
jgi:hypothetical protein